MAASARALHLLAAAALVVSCASLPELNLVRDCGGKGDGATLNDGAWAACLAALSRAGGGSVFVPAGTYLSSPFNITTSDTTLILGGGAVLRASPDESRWPLVLPLPSLGCCREYPQSFLRFSAFLTVWNSSRVRITSNASAGEAPGALYGDGPVWWLRRKSGNLTRDPGALLELMYADHVEVDGIDVLFSPYYHVHPFASSFLHFHDMRISSLHGGPETDGLDPDSSHDILIERVAIDTGDDAIAVKSGWDLPGITFGRPSFNILIRDSTLSTEANAFCMGSEMSGGIYNVTARNISCVNVGTCFRLKSALGRGGEIRDIAMFDSRIVGAKYAIEASDFYGGHPGPVNASLVPRVGRMTVKNLTGVLVQAAGDFEGLPNSFIDDVTLEDIDLDAAAGSWKCSNVSGTSANVRPAPCAALQG
jgi:polygalacturonase